MSRSLRLALLAVLAASHGVNDLLAGWLLGGPLPETDLWGRIPWLVAYAALAFAGQMPVAWLIQRWRHHGRWLVAALVLMILTVALRGVSVGSAIIVSGVASAICHVAGGALAMQLPRGERALGWFAAPGILGLTLGGWLGHLQSPSMGWMIFLPAGLLAACFALRVHWPEMLEADAEDWTIHGVDAHDALMLLLLLALTLRSALWDLAQAANLTDPTTVALIAASAAAGKVLGGWMISRFPKTQHVSVVMFASCLLLDFARWNLALLCLGIALLQSTIPSSIVLLRRNFGASPAMAAAYGLGATVALGGLVAPAAGNDMTIMSVALAGTAGLLLWRTMSHQRRLRLAG